TEQPSATPAISGQMRSMREAEFGHRPRWLMPTTRCVAPEITGAPSEPSAVSQKYPTSVVGGARLLLPLSQGMGSTAQKPPVSRSDQIAIFLGAPQGC